MTIFYRILAWLLGALELARDNLQFLPPNYVVEKIDAAIAQAKEQS